MSDQSAERDFLRQPLQYLILWGIPIAALIATFVLPLGATVEKGMTTAAFAWIGTACILNAVHCNRVHCWFTGPWSLLVAAALFTNAFIGFRPFALSFSVIANVGGIVTILFWLLPELVLGKYFGRRPLALPTS